MILLEKVLSVKAVAGVARITALPDRARERWRVSRYVTHTNSTTPTELSVYSRSESSARLDYTGSGNDDVSELPTRIAVEFGRPLVFVWEGMSTNAVAEITVYGELERI